MLTFLDLFFLIIVSTFLVSVQPRKTPETIKDDPTLKWCDKFDLTSASILDASSVVDKLTQYRDKQRMKIVDSIGKEKLIEYLKDAPELNSCLLTPLYKSTIELLYEVLRKNTIDKTEKDFILRMMSILKHFTWKTIEVIYTHFPKGSLRSDLQRVFPELYKIVYAHVGDPSIKNLQNALNAPDNEDKYTNVLKLLFKMDSNKILTQVDNRLKNQLDAYSISVANKESGKLIRYLISDAYDRETLISTWMNEWISSEDARKMCVLLASRAEMDLNSIKKKFGDIYRKPLKTALEDGFSNKKVLTALQNFVDGNMCTGEEPEYED